MFGKCTKQEATEIGVCNSNGFDSENSLFGGFMADNSGHFDSELQQIDEPEINRDLSPNKSEEDYHQTFLEWQQHISTLQERDDRSEFLCHPVPLSMPDIFAPPTQIEDDIKSSSIITGDIFPVEIDDKIFIDGNIMNVIKTEVESPMELEDNCINVKEIPETMPVLEAGDLTTLLEQFEVSEAVNEEAAPSILPLPVIEPVKIASHPNAQIKKDITEVLPKEVVDRIEVTGSIKGESVQFDHDYCTNTNNANDDKQFVECYKSEQPDYKKGEVFSVPGNRDKWEYSKKDSGLESGEMSDTSEGSLEKSRQCLPNDVDNFSLKEEPLLTIKVEPKAYYDEPVVSILQPLKEVKMEADDNTIDDGIEKKSSSQAFIAKEEPSVEVKPEQKKKKLNLEEYRKRRKNMILSTPLSNNSASRPSDSTSSNATVKLGGTGAGDTVLQVHQVLILGHILTEEEAAAEVHPYQAGHVQDLEVVAQSGVTSPEVIRETPATIDIQDILHLVVPKDRRTGIQKRKENSDNYGFVTFAYRVDAYEAVEHGNDNPDEPRYDICFGGRRAFCQQRYSDLDGLSTQEFSPGPYQHQHQHHARTNDSFDILLREAQENIRKRSNV
ncbi:hypothetical protein AAG570_009498 [Ranatra chinensis]|uniref:RRM domain-containing protein n=1 Tax=Ranatra chinensis TaxID=642074 RepID=A0ABD0Z039_9HEMI